MIKKTFTLLALIGLAVGTFAQTEVAEKKIPQLRFGLKTGGNVAWTKSQSTQVLSEGIGLGFKLGAMLDFRLANSANYALSTGVGISSMNAKIKYPEFFEVSDVQYVGTEESRFRINYVDIPLLLKGKTNEIGYLTYFGQIGAGLGFRYRATAMETREGIIVDTNGVDPTGTKVPFGEIENDIQSETQFLRVSFIVGGGIEYNLTGNTNVYAAINFNNGLLNAFNRKGDDQADTGIYEADGNGNAKINAFKPEVDPANAGNFDVRLNYITLDVGIFF